MCSAQCSSQQLLHFEQWLLVLTTANYDSVTTYVAKDLFFYTNLSIQ